MSVAENDSPAMWARLNDLLARAEGAPAVGDRYGFYESGADCSQTTFEEGTAVRAFIGAACPEGCAIEGFAEKRFSGGRYARFVHRGRVEDLPSAYRYLWGVWFPQSGYDLADRDDFERYGPASSAPTRPPPRSRCSSLSDRSAQGPQSVKRSGYPPPGVAFIPEAPVIPMGNRQPERPSFWSSRHPEEPNPGRSQRRFWQKKQPR